MWTQNEANNFDNPPSTRTHHENAYAPCRTELSGTGYSAGLLRIHQVLRARAWAQGLELTPPEAHRHIAKKVCDKLGAEAVVLHQLFIAFGLTSGAHGESINVKAWEGP